MKWFGTVATDEKGEIKKDSAGNVMMSEKGHTQYHTRPIIDKVINALKAGKFPGVGKVTSIGAVGYCFGARYVFDLAFDNVISSAAVAHPSLLEIPADLEVCTCALLSRSTHRPARRNTPKPRCRS